MSGFPRPVSQASSYHRDEATDLDVWGPDATGPPPPHNGQNIKEPTTVWSYYNQKAEQYDKDLVEDANSTVDVLLIFAGLFSAVVTAFISQTYPMLKRDSNDIMTSVYQQLRQPGSNTTLDDPFIVPPYAVRVNCCLFAGLFTSMLVASLGILVKQWTRSYQGQLAGVSSAHLRARVRHFRYYGAQRCHFSGIVGMLSIFMLLALFISALGIIDLLFSTVNVVGVVALSVFLLAASFFIVTTIIPLFLVEAPFRSPLSELFSWVFSPITKPIGRMVPSLSSPISNLFSRIFSPMKEQIRRMGQVWSTRTKQPDEENGAEPKAGGAEPGKVASGLEDDVGQSQGKDSDEKSIARTRLHLDLDIICDLLSTADKSTERWVLEACFEKLPQLQRLQEMDPHCFRSRTVIFEVFDFLAKGCIMVNTKGVHVLRSDRLRRAQVLCGFMNWLLSLPRDAEQDGSLRKTLEKKGAPLARLVAKDIQGKARTIITAATTLGRFEHLDSVTGLDSCTICERAFPSDWEDAQPADEEKARLIILGLVQCTDCMLVQEKNTTVSEEQCARSLAALERALEKYKAPDKEKERNVWTQLLTDKEKEASMILKKKWLYPVRDLLKAPLGSSSSSKKSTYIPPATTVSGSSSLPLPGSSATTTPRNSPLNSPPITALRSPSSPTLTPTISISEPGATTSE